MFSDKALHEKGAKLDLRSNPPVLRNGNDAFPISTEFPRVFVLHILLDGQEESHHISHRAVDTDKWHRRVGPFRPRSLKQPPEELTIEMNDIGRSGAGTPSVIGCKCNEMTRKRVRR